MKNLLLILTLLFSSVFLSSPSYAGWTEVSKNVHGIYYLDFEKIRKHDGFVYYWIMTDYLKPFKGVLSAKSYHQGDCKLFRHKGLSGIFYKEPMGGGTRITHTSNNPKWNYTPPNSVWETILKTVCNR